MAEDLKRVQIPGTADTRAPALREVYGDTAMEADRVLMSDQLASIEVKLARLIDAIHGLRRE